MILSIGYRLLERVCPSAAMYRRWGWCLVLSAWCAGPATGEDALRQDVHAGATRAVSFLVDKVSTQGGYLWRYAEDLSLREGEGVVETATVWVQPPGTPAVGEAFLQLYQATKAVVFLDAARRAGEVLRRGQMESGGWQAMVELEPARRQRWAYRIDGTERGKKDQSSLDDDKTQSALRFVIRLDQALGFADPQVHEMAQYGIEALVTRGQFAHGGFPQVWTNEPLSSSSPTARANVPSQWSRTYEGHQEYWSQATLNDNLAPDVWKTLLLAAQVYTEPRYRQAAIRLADFLVRAQLPEPQPAWAQQYNAQLQPIWARKFEPPSITGGESQGVIEMLLSAYAETRDKKYLSPVPSALAYLRRIEIAPGRLARFYELETDRPLYFDRAYRLTYDDSDLPTHYAFQINSRVDRLQRDYDRLRNDGPRPPRRPRVPSEQEVREVLRSLDARGAWVSRPGQLKYHRIDVPVIDMRVAIERLGTLAAYLAATAPAEESENR